MNHLKSLQIMDFKIVLWEFYFNKGENYSFGNNGTGTFLIPLFKGDDT